MPRYIKNVEQQRARQAYRFVETIQQNAILAKDYKSHIRSLPMMIKNNGINNAFAFVLSKSKEGNAYQVIDTQMREWFDITTESSFVEYLIKLDSLPYRKITIETLAFLSWLKRFAEGLIEDPKTENKEVKNGN